MVDEAQKKPLAALLGRGTRYQGTLTFDGTVRIDGQLEGEVFSRGTLVVGDGAMLRGEIHVGTLLVLGGETWGRVVASELVEIHEGAVVHADIETKRIFVDRGAIFDGKCSMEGGTPERRWLDEDETVTASDEDGAPSSGESNAIISGTSNKTIADVVSITNEESSSEPKFDESE